MPRVQAAGAGTSGRGRRTAGSLSGINVVPLVDVMLVLLIIFMVTAPMLQRGIDVKVPVSRRASAVTGERVFVSVPLTYKQDRMVYIDNEAIRVDVLAERIRQRLENRTDKGVYLQSAAGLLVQDFMDVVDLLKDAGVENVGIVAQPPSAR